MDRADINLRGGLAAQAEVLRKAFTLDELEAMDARIEAVRNGETKQLPWPAGVPDVKPVPDKTHTQDPSGVAVDRSGVAVDQASEAKLDSAGDGRTGRGTEPGKLPVASFLPAPHGWPMWGTSALPRSKKHCDKLAHTFGVNLAFPTPILILHL